MGENPYKGSGINAFRNGGEQMSYQERKLDENRKLSFKESVLILQEHAEKIAHHAKTHELVKRFLHEVGGIEKLNPENCEKFAEEHSNHFYEGPMVYAVALAIERERRSSH
jgi:hypothetical protein